MDAIALGWFVVPGVVGSALGSIFSLVWQHRAARDLRALESRLRKQEESYRLAQSPRVAAAIDLWSALCEYERCFKRLLNPAWILHAPPEIPLREWNASSEEHKRELLAELQRAWAAVAPARDRAEVLLPHEALAAFGALFKAYESAQGTHRMFGAFPGDERSQQQFIDELVASMNKAEAQRPLVLLAVKALLEEKGA